VTNFHIVKKTQLVRLHL